MKYAKRDGNWINLYEKHSGKECYVATLSFADWQRNHAKEYQLCN